jgi:hypothetical protein
LKKAAAFLLAQRLHSVTEKSQESKDVQTLVIPDDAIDDVLDFLRSNSSIADPVTETGCRLTLALVERDFHCTDLDNLDQ